MKLPSIQTKTVKMPSGGGEFTVSGFSLPDILILVQRQGPGLAAAFDEYQRSMAEGNLSFEASASIMSALITSFPDVVAEVITIASGGTSDELVALVKKYPISVQLDALTKIGSLTFTEEMPPKKVFETVINVFQQVNSQAEPTIED